MPLSYDYIEKPRPVMLIDELFSGDQDQLAAAFDFARSLLDSGEALDQTTEQLSGTGFAPVDELTSDDAEHFREHWLDADKRRHAWSGPEVGTVMHDAYLAAIEAASGGDTLLPIETFWVFSPIRDFEMRVRAGKTQVTVFALIPIGDEIQFGPRDDGDGIFNSFS